MAKEAHAAILYFKPHTYRENVEAFKQFPQINRKLDYSEKIDGLINALVQKSCRKQWNSGFLMLSLIYELIYEVSSLFSAEKDYPETITEKAVYDKMMEIENYIFEHYSENITLQDLAKRYNYSESAMSRFFTAYFNMTFSDYYKEVRLSKAKNDLLYTELTISEIALKNGWSSLRSFQRAFLSRNHMTPSEYRKCNSLSDTDVLQS